MQSLINERHLSRIDPVVGEFREQAKAEQKAALIELLGEVGYQSATAYARTEPARALVAGIAGTAAVAGATIPVSQLEQLVQVVANASPSYRKGENVNQYDIDWNLVDEQARAFLSASQWIAMTTRQSPRYPSGGDVNRFTSRIGVSWEKASQAERANQPWP